VAESHLPWHRRAHSACRCILGNFDHNRTAIFVYAAVIFSGELIALILWQYVSRRALVRDAPARERSKITARIGVVLAVILAAVGLAWWNTEGSIVAFAVAPFVSFLPAFGDFGEGRHASRTDA
jgi:hypothetical protein